MIQSKTPKSQISNWSWAVGLLLLTWGLRLCFLDTVPPGWRDDALINIHALSGEPLAGRFPLYFTGASGHEPLYHYLHAGVHAVLGLNVLSGQLLSIVLGTLTVALTYALSRRLFGRKTAVIASLALATSFWSLMYSRTAIRHISLPPLVLAAFYLLWRQKPGCSVKGATGTWFLIGLVVGASWYTYPAARLLPVLLVLFAVYLALFHREQFNRCWRGFLLALVIAFVVIVPLWIAIAQGSSEAAAQGIGADARLAELAVPIQELQAGNPRPLLENISGTLGMFHTTGDPEWLYNISGRPVFNLLGGALLWAGVLLCLYRWRQPKYFFLFLWLGLGLLPAFASVPPASLSHTILAHPVAYILPAMAVTEAQSRISNLKSQIGRRLLGAGCWTLVILFLTTNAVRDLRDYFVVWPQQDMVRLLYRADYRETARYLDDHPEITDVAVSSALMGPWDRLALDVDVQRDDVTVRLFNPERALVWVSVEQASPVLFTSWPRPSSPIDDLLGTSDGAPETISPHLTLYAIEKPQSVSHDSIARFTNGLELTKARWMNEDFLAPGQETVLLTIWLVAAPLDLPPMPIVANPPPPGVYSGPRLAVFTHLLAADGTFLTGDDGLWVDPLTLQPGDRFIQAHRLTLPPDAPDGSYDLELGLYDPLTGERWGILDSAGQPAADHVVIPTVSK